MAGYSAWKIPMNHAGHKSQGKKCIELVSAGLGSRI